MHSRQILSNAAVVALAFAAVGVPLRLPASSGTSTAPQARTPVPTPTPARVFDGGDISFPTEISRANPDYSGVPDAARGYGVCILEGVVTVAGTVTDIRVLRPTPIPHRCKPAVDAVVRSFAQWRYRPAIRGGRPVPVYVTLTVTHCTSCVHDNPGAPPTPSPSKASHP